MKKSKERFLSFTLSSKTRAASMKIAMTLTAAAVFAMSPAAPAVVGTEITVQAADYYKDSTDANIQFTVNEDGKTATIYNYTGSASSLTIPETVSYGGTTYTVTAIGNEAFGKAHGTTDLSTTEIVIPGTVKTIGYSAFEGSSSIKKITIGEGVQSIGERAFYGLTGLTEISFPESVVYIGPSICENNTSLKTVTIAGEIFEYDFGSGAFSGCTSLETVNITGSVDQIPDEAFFGCTKLSSLTLAEGITRIGDDAFYGCEGLKTISLPSTVKSIGSSAFSESGLTEIVVPENVTEIEMSAFAECTALESVTINGRITEIPNSLFYNCTNLKTVKLPVGITSIGSSAFYENNSLTNIAIGRSGVSDYTLIIPDTVTSIKQNAFYSEGRSADNKFTYVDMGSGVSSLGASAFEGFKTTTVITSKALDKISNYAFCNTGAENVYITRVPEKDESTVVNMDAFSGCSIKELYLPSSVKTNKALKSNCFEGSEVSNNGKNRVIPKIYTNASATTSLTLDQLKGIMSYVQDSGDWTWYNASTTVTTKALADALPLLSGQGTADSAETVAVTSVSLNKSSIELAVGDTKTLTKTISPSNATISNVEWTSSDPNVVAVSANGRIRGISAGTATITVTTDDGAKTDTCTVTVSGEVSKVSVTGVSLDKAAVELTEGDTTTLTATVTPDNATNTDVTWASNNPSVATVDAEGKVTAVAAGDAIITVTTADEEMTATCAVKVTAKTTEIENFVDRLYTNLLNQSVNATDKASYVNSLSTNEKKAAEVVAKFALDASIAEISNEEFVSRMYSAVFNRNADEGKKHYENLLNNGMSRKIVIQKFTESEEFTNICASCGMTQGTFKSDEIRDSNIEVTSFVNNLYLTILGRTPDILEETPNLSGINCFTRALLKGASTDGIIKEFILGDEYKGWNFTNEEFIISCFRGILGRTETTIGAIDGGKLFLDTLDAGILTREGIVNSLLDSEEYKNRLYKYGLNK